MSPPNSLTTTGLELTVPVASDITTDPPPDRLTDEISGAAEDVATDPGEVCDEPRAATRSDPTATGWRAHARRFARLRGFAWQSLLAYRVLPAVAVLLALGAGYVKWHDDLSRRAQQAAEQSSRAAADTTTAMLSYKPDTVEQDLVAASGRLTGSFKNDYTSLIHDVVIPGAQQKHVSAVATVPATASVSATGNHAVVLVFVDQTTIIGNDAPTSTASSVRVTLDKVGDRWLISKFDPL